MQAPARRATTKWLFFSRSGRAGRQVFVLGVLFWMAVNSFAFSKLALDHEDDEMLPLLALVVFATLCLSVFSTVMLTIKRLHDIGLSGMFACLIFVPVISFVMLIALCLWPSTPEANGFGSATDWPAT